VRFCPPFSEEGILIGGYCLLVGWGMWLVVSG